MKNSLSITFALCALVGTIKTISPSFAESLNTSYVHSTRRERRISYGHPAPEINTFVVALHDKSHAQGICAGSVISKRLVLTAYHCVINSAVDHVRALTLDGRNEIPHTVERIINYPKFLYRAYPDFFENDIPIIVLTTPIANSQIIPLAPKNFTVPRNSEVTVFGWGRTESEEQTHSFKSTQLKVSWCGWPVLGAYFTEYVCTFSTKSGPCKGDSGGPVVYQDYLVGIVSWAEFNCGKGGLAVHTAVSAYRDWIDKYIAMYP